MCAIRIFCPLMLFLFVHTIRIFQLQKCYLLKQNLICTTNNANATLWRRIVFSPVFCYTFSCILPGFTWNLKILISYVYDFWLPIYAEIFVRCKVFFFKKNIFASENYCVKMLCTLLHYLLTPWNRVLLEKLTGWQLVKKFLVFYGTRRFIIAFARARLLSLSWARSIQSMPPTVLPEDPS